MPALNTCLPQTLVALSMTCQIKKRWEKTPNTEVLAVPEALAMLEKARSLRPYDGYIVDSVGWTYYRLGRYDEAAQTLEAAVLLVPGDATINDHFGDALWKAGHKMEARFQWDHALNFGPEDSEKASLEQKLASVQSKQRRLTAENAKLREQLQAAEQSLAQAQERESADRIAGRFDTAEVRLLERLLSPLRDQGDRREQAGTA